MDAKRVSELLEQIQQAEQEAEAARREAAEAQTRHQNKVAAVDELKQELAREVSGYLPKGGGRKAGTKPRLGGTGKRHQEVLMNLFADGQPHDTQAARAALEAAGLEPGNVSMTLSLLHRAGRIARLSRGVYRRVE